MARRTTPVVSEAAGDFIRQRFARNANPGVRYMYRSLLRRFGAYVNDCQVGSLTPGHVEDFFYGPGGLAESCQASSLARYRGDLKAWLAWCHRRGYITVHPDLMLGGISEKSTRVNRNRYRMTPDELIRFLNAAEDPRDRALVAFIANTGCRISEALGMRIKDVRLERGEMYVYVVKTKEEDIMPITSDLDVELRRWLHAYQEACGPLQKHWRLFPARGRSGFIAAGPEDDGRAVRGRVYPYMPENKINNPGRIVKVVAEAAGIELEPGDAWHTLRRSVARIYFDAASANGHDAALRETAALLHHSTTQVTERYLGLELEKRKRDQVLKGQPFLTKLVSESNVVPMRPRDEKEA